MDGLRRIGASLGSAEWVQGPGGNVSIKEGETLFVKASGKRLRDLGQGGAHAAVPLADARAALAGDEEAERRTFSRTPRPSLETYFHAIGGAVVAHTHAIGAMLVACSSLIGDLQSSAATRLATMLTVPYERPGRGLALLVEKALAGRREGVVLLEQHGLVVYAETVDAAIAMSQEADAALRAPFGELPSFAALVAAPYTVEAAHGSGVFTTLPRREARAARFLFPDAVVFASVARVPSFAGDPAKAARDALASFGRPVVLLADDGSRLQCARNADELAQAREVALSHDYVEDVLTSRGAARYLAESEPAKIVGMPAEQYRLALTRENPC